MLNLSILHHWSNNIGLLNCREFGRLLGILERWHLLQCLGLGQGSQRLVTLAARLSFCIGKIVVCSPDCINLSPLLLSKLVNVRSDTVVLAHTSSLSHVFDSGQLPVITQLPALLCVADFRKVGFRVDVEVCMAKLDRPLIGLLGDGEGWYFRSRLQDVT